MIEPMLVSVSASVLANILSDFIKKKRTDPELLKKLEQEVSKRVGKQPPLVAQTNDLIEAYKEERLVLVLGAGVSADHGLPSWNTLLQKLLLSTFMSETSQSKEKSQVLAKIFTEFFSPSPLVAARYLRTFYESDNESNKMPFDEAVRNAIYDEINLKKSSKTINEIVNLCVAPGKSPNLDSIITYNYDDLIEYHLSKLKIDVPYKSVFDVGMNPTTKELPIYHVHGFLPQDVKLEKNNKVTLSEDVYHQQYSDIYSWNNIVQINKFRDCKCLFIGISFTDPNLRRLLDISKQQKGSNAESHYIIRKKYNLNKIEENISKILDQNADLFDEKVKANLKLDETVKYLVKVIEMFEENDAKSFDVGTIWVKEWDEIPKILRSIRSLKANGIN
ncbi:MAG: SIR2 family protein [Thermodesulfobacteriota bacterium]|nr:SIR2 family protein [Thermodesulfobacteriota bacterium]